MEMLCGGRTAGCEEVHCLGSAVTPPLKGRKRWPLTLLESAVLELNVVDSASDNMIGRRLKSTFKPHLQEQWFIPPEANAAFVAAREDVLAVYQRPHDPDHPVVCLDETTKQLHQANPCATSREAGSAGAPRQRTRAQRHR